jgi:hypothetical protein
VPPGSAPPARLSTNAAPVTLKKAPPGEPPYDLAADCDHRIDEARRELGRGVPVTVESDVFVVAGAPGWGPSNLETSVVLTRKALAGFFNGRFGKRPERAISIYLFPADAPYQAYCRGRWGDACISVFGFYRPDERKIVMNAGRGIGTLTHELVHPILENDFPLAPTWIDEGIASLFEAPVIPGPGEIHGATNWRLPRLRAALASKTERDLARLDHLFGLPNDEFRGDEEPLYYASARYVCQWLDARGELWPFFQRWRDHAGDDPTGVESFRAVTGLTPAEANEIWTRWARRI